MKSLELNVPLIAQDKTMSCWHASYRMLHAYKYKSSVNPLNEVYSSNSGAYPSDFRQLAKEFGVKIIHGIPATLSYEYFFEFFTKNQPVMMIWYWKSGGGHAVVAHGGDGENLLIRDPSPIGTGSRAKISLQTINSRLAHKPSRFSLLYLP